MTIQKIYTKLKEAVIDDKLNFLKTIITIGFPTIEKRLTDSLVQSTLVFEGVKITMPDKNTILVHGTTALFANSNLSTGLLISYQNKILQTTLKGSFTGERLSLPGVDWINFGEPSIELTVANDSSSPYGKFGGSVNAGVKFDIFVSYPVAKNKWLFQVAFTEQYNISNFLALVGGENLAGQLPSPLNAFADLAPQEIDISYNTKDKVIDYVAMNIGTSADNVWKILPGLKMKGLLIKCLVENPGDSSKRKTSFNIDGTFDIGKGENIGTFGVGVQVPKLKANVGLKEGKVALGDLLTIFWADTSIDLKAFISIFNLSIDTASKNFLLNTRIDSDWTFITFGSTSLKMTGLTLEINHVNGTTLGSIVGMFHIGTDDDGIDLNISASHPSIEEGWVFNANTKGSIDIGGLIHTFFNDLNVPLPDWVAKPAGVPLTITDIDFTANVPPSSGAKKNSYNAKGTVSWGIKYQSFEATVEATPDITYNANLPEGKRTSGKIVGDIKFLGLEFQIGYIFGTEGDKTLYVEWNGLKGSYSESDKEKIFEVKIENKTLGNLITDFVRIFEQGFSLKAPWNVLNEINLSGLDFKYITSKSDGSTKMELSWPLGLNLGFLTIKDITLTKDSTGVFLGFEGQFLGMKIEAGNPDTEKLAGKGSDVRNMPSAPGLGEKFFDLQYLGLGQHVALYPTKNLDSVEQATTALMNVFQDPPPPVDNKPVFPIGPQPSDPEKSVLVFSEESNWLIGTKFTVVSAIDVSIIFNDPNLYGLLISVSDKFQYFKGLNFEILYKKITDSIGVYQMELTLPDYLRQMEFGAVSITLPVIGVDIYTNGNFKIDLGFPASITVFSRSFTVQAFPFIGQGGFYFASLTGATSKNLPVTTQGEFNPVIAFGIGLSLGLGKPIEKGILKAGLTVTFVGIVEGIIAKYNAYPQSSSQSLKGDGEHYYWLQGTFGLVGKLYGEINFAIISARLDITVYAYIRVTIEAYKAIPVYLEAGVSVKLSVKVNLGLFKITIKLSFSATISENFTIGSDTSKLAPWYESTRLQKSMMLMAQESFDKITWQPLIMEEGEQLPINLYYMPHLSVSGEGGSQQGKFANTLYIDSPDKETSNNTSLEHLARGVLAWTINALLNAHMDGTKYSDLLEQPVTLKDIRILFCYLSTRKDNLPAFNFINKAGNDIEHFLQNFFSINILDPDHANVPGNEVNAGLMPILPLLNLITTYNGKEVDNIDFSSKNMTGNNGYLKAVKELFARMSVSYQNDLTSAYYALDGCTGIIDHDYENQPNLSVANFLFTDFITLIAKASLQNAMDLMATKGSMTVSELLSQVNTVANMNNLNGQSSRYLLHGIRLPEPPNAVSGEVYPLYELSGQQVTIPTGLKQDDKYELKLKANANVSWVAFNSEIGGTASVLLDNSEIQRIIETKGINLVPKLETGFPANMPLYNDALQAFTFKNDINWKYPGNLFPPGENGDKVDPTVWKIPDSMLDALSTYSGNNLSFDLQTITREGESSVTKTPIKDFVWATFLEVTVQKIDPSGGDSPSFNSSVDVIGADETGIAFLENLMRYVNINGDDIVKQIQFLYVPDKTADDPNGLLSAANGDVIAALVQANLSTETNPVSAMAMRTAMFAEKEEPNVLNGYKEFIRLMWQCSIVRTGGYYLYYITKEGQKSFPSHLFNDDSTGKIFMVVTYNNFVNGNFVNSLIVGDKIDTSETSLYAQSDTLTQRISTLPAGVIGFEIDRQNPGGYIPPVKNKEGKIPPPSVAQDEIYLENQFNLLGYQLYGIIDSRNLMPIGAADELDENDLKALKNDTYSTANDGSWKYRGVIPYHKFASSVLPNDSELPSPVNDPYAGIGEIATIKFNWQDMFGNEINTPIDSSMLTPKIQYTDPIIGLSLWPAVTSGYNFGTESGTPEIKLNLWFDLKRYQADPINENDLKLALKKAQADLLTYTTLYYQLGHSSDISIFFQSSIDGTEKQPTGSERAVDQAKLYGYVKSIIKFLNLVIAARGAYPDDPKLAVPYQISDLIKPKSIADYTNIYELTVDFTIKRIANVDADFLTTDTEIATTRIQPPTIAEEKTKGKSKEDSPLSLTEFALLFESTFENQPNKGITLKLATGVTRTGKDNEKNKKVWVTRFDNSGKAGIKYDFDNTSPYFFSPIPLANSLKSYKNVDIFNYVRGEGLPQTPSQQLNFSGVDLDAWGRSFLIAVDDFLNAKYAVPAYLLDNGVTLQKVLKQKQALADAIEGTMDYIIEPDDKNKSLIANAQEKFKQSVLIKLVNSYSIDTVVQTPMTVYSSFEGDNNDPPESKPFVPRLYGKMIGLDPQAGTSDTDSSAYSLSNAKVPLGVKRGSKSGTSWLNYLVSAKQPGDQRRFSFGNMQYEVTHIEHQIDNVAGVTDYLASSWLTFVLPLKKSLGNIGNIDIPIPLRAYPTPPSITSQAFKYDACKNGKKIKAVADVRTWGYTYAYARAGAAQDVIHTQIELNIPVQGSNSQLKSAVFAKIYTLPERLAAFTKVYPAIQSDLVQYLSQITGQTDRDGTEFKNAQKAAEAFATLTEWVAKAWSSWNQVNPRGVRAEKSMFLQEVPKPKTYKYKVSEYAEENTGSLIVAVVANPANPDGLMPTLDLAGNNETYDRVPVKGEANAWTYKVKPTGKIVLFSDRDEIPERMVGLGSLDIVNEQNAWSGALITRNEELLQSPNGGWQTTNKSFIYQTPLVKFYNQLNPLLVCNERIEVAEIGSDGSPVQPQQLALARHMQNLFGAIVKDMQVDEMNLKLEVQYSYSFTGTKPGQIAIPIAVPVLLATPFNLNKTTDLDIGTAGNYCPKGNDGFVCYLSKTILEWFKINKPNQALGQLSFKIDLNSSFSQVPMLKLLDVTLNIDYVDELKSK